jgi:hypothetical protein
MIIGKARLEVRHISVTRSFSNTRAAAFLTQTVTLEDQTTVKFEIW